MNIVEFFANELDSPALRQLATLLRMNPRDVFERFWSHGLRLHDFTALFGCKDPARARELLNTQERVNAYSDVHGLHTLRWMLFDPRFQNGVDALPGAANQALVLSFVCDGNVGEMLDALADHKRPQLLELLALCHGFDSSTSPARFIRQHAVPSGYLFRDRGPLGKDWSRLPDSSLAEIKSAFEAEGKFVKCYAQHRSKPAAERRQEFLRTFESEGFPFPLQPWERRVPEEEAATRQLVDAARKIQDKAARASNDGLIRRGAHAKAHGLLEATFEILDIPSQDQRVGLFSERKVYRALLRCSNGSGLVQRDATADARGLALRVLVSPAEPLAGARPEFLPGSEPAALPGAGSREFAYQDFVLMNSPVFVAPNVKRFADWLCTIKSESTAGRLAGALALAWRHPRDVWLIMRSVAGHLTNPLGATYHSTTPYQFGERFIAKYSVEPDDPSAFRKFVLRKPGNYLSAELKRSLGSGPLQLTLYLHVLPVDAVPGGFESLADVVEDATLDWRKLGAKKVPVAVVRVGPQDPASVARLERAERIHFNPWNALVQHRPLGSFNRARYSAYPASQKYRQVALAAADAALQQAAE